MPLSLAQILQTLALQTGQQSLQTPQIGGMPAGQWPAPQAYGPRPPPTKSIGPYFDRGGFYGPRPLPDKGLQPMLQGPRDTMYGPHPLPGKAVGPYTDRPTLQGVLAGVGKQPVGGYGGRPSNLQPYKPFGY